VSVRSDGLGLGSTFTLKLPLSCSPVMDSSQGSTESLKGDIEVKYVYIQICVV
jgi:hypothetical protein